LRRTVRETIRDWGEVGEIPRERERYVLGGGSLGSLRHRNERNDEDGRARHGGDKRPLACSGAARQGAQDQADKGESGEEEACLLKEHDDEPLRAGGGRDSAE
jgi:hypothetical protein